MRFSAAIQPQQPLRERSVGQLIRSRLALAQPAKLAEPALPRVDDPPVDLDQRVRLVGEW